MRGWGIIAAFLVVCAASESAAGAPPANGPPPTEEARVLFKKGDYRGALDVLERAQKSSPDPRLFWNMAACETKLGHHARAISYVERYLAATPSLTPDERATGAQFITAAKAYVGVIAVTSNVDGTQVLVDGELVATTPLSKPFAVDQGAHRVRFARPGYQAIERSETVPGGADLRWTAELVREATPETSAPGVAQARVRPSALGPLLLVGGGVVVAGTGGVLVGISLGQAAQLRSDCGSACAPERWQKYRTMQDIGDVMIVAGAVAVTAGFGWWLLQPKGGRDTPRAWVAPTTGGLVVGGAL